MNVLTVAFQKELNRSYSIQLITKVTTLGLLGFLTSIGEIYFAFMIINVSLPLINIVIYAALLRLLLIYRFVPGNVGVQELAYGYLATISDLYFSYGVAISVFIRVSSLILLSFLSFIFYLFEMRSSNSVSLK